MKAHVTPSRSRRLARAAAVVVAGSTLLAGCQIISPRQTDHMYNAAEGVSVDVGEVQVRNLLIVADQAGGPGVVSAALGNPTKQDATVSFAFSGGGTPAQVTVPANGAVNVSADGQRVQLSPLPNGADNKPAGPGDIVSMTVSTAGSGGSPVNVPVVPASGYWQTLAPSAAAS